MSKCMMSRPPPIVSSPSQSKPAPALLVIAWTSRLSRSRKPDVGLRHCFGPDTRFRVAAIGDDLRLPLVDGQVGLVPTRGDPLGQRGRLRVGVELEVPLECAGRLAELLVARVDLRCAVGAGGPGLEVGVADHFAAHEQLRPHDDVEDRAVGVRLGLGVGRRIEQIRVGARIEVYREPERVQTLARLAQRTRLLAQPAARRRRNLCELCLRARQTIGERRVHPGRLAQEGWSRYRSNHSVSVWVTPLTRSVSASSPRRRMSRSRSSSAIRARSAGVAVWLAFLAYRARFSSISALASPTAGMSLASSAVKSCEALLGVSLHAGQPRAPPRCSRPGAAGEGPRHPATRSRWFGPGERTRESARPGATRYPPLAWSPHQDSPRAAASPGLFETMPRVIAYGRRANARQQSPWPADRCGLVHVLEEGQNQRVGVVGGAHVRVGQHELGHVGVEAGGLDAG